MEIIAAILTLTCVILTIRSNILCWPFSILSSLAYMYVFIDEHIYFQVGVQSVFIIQSIYGWRYWGRVKNFKEVDTSWVHVVVNLTIILFLTLIFYVILNGKTDNPQLCLDILTSLLSLLGVWYLAVRNIFGWFIWVLADVFFILMFMEQHMYWSTGLYFVLLFLTIKGLIQWGKNITTV